MDISSQYLKNAEYGDLVGVNLGTALTDPQIQQDFRIPWQEIDNAITGAGLLTRSSGSVSQLSDAIRKLITPGASPFTATKYADATYPITSTTNPYVFNLFAATGSGARVRIINISSASTGLIKIVPNTGDKIGPLAVNVAAYLQNVDQSGYKNQNQELVLVDHASGVWTIESGQFMPEPPATTDSAGAQYFLGKLRHMPLGNTIVRNVSTTIPSASSFSSAVTAVGTASGVPIGAKAILARVRVGLAVTAGGSAVLDLFFSDNNTSTPATNTGHPGMQTQAYLNAAGTLWFTSEMVIPLDSSGRYYVYNFASSNVTLASSALTVVPTGYYMGD